MTATPDTDIRCTRCDSTVPWGPFCPRCGAYLEFVGQPPWQPDLSGTGTTLEYPPRPAPAPFTEEVIATETVERVDVPVDGSAFDHLYSTQSEAAGGSESKLSSGMGFAAVVGVLVVGVVGGLGLTLLTNGWIGGVFAVMCLAWALVLLPRPRRDTASTAPAARTSRAGIAAVAGLVVLGVIGGVGLTYLTNAWIGVTFGLVCLAWAIVLWPRPGVPVEAPPESEAVTEVESVTEVVVVETVARVEEPVVVAEPDVVEARAPQYVPTRAIEVPVSQPSQSVAGDVPCPACGELNVSGRHFCEWCGEVMGDATLAPTTVAQLDHIGDLDDEADSSGRSPRLSRSWRGPIVAGTLAFVFLSAVVLAVFGPFAFQFRLGTTQLFQAINQFIDPYAGNQTNIESASASSSLLGTSPQEGVGNDGATFWASGTFPDYGAGESLTAVFDRPYTINRAVVLPGIQNGLFDVNALATPATITLIFDDGSKVTDVLDATLDQNDLRQLVSFPNKTTRSVTMRIDTVYLPRNLLPEGVGEVANSGLYFLQPPQPPSILSVPTEIRTNPALPGTTN